MHRNVINIFSVFLHYFLFIILVKSCSNNRRNKIKTDLGIEKKMIIQVKQPKVFRKSSLNRHFKKNLKWKIQVNFFNVNEAKIDFSFFI